MIPLAKWLQDDGPVPIFGETPGFAEPITAVSEDVQRQHQEEVESAYQRGREEAGAEWELRLARAIAECEAGAAEREASAAAEWAARFSENLVSEIAGAVATMRNHIESSVEKALARVLEGTVRERIAQALLQSIEAEVLGTGKLPIEIAAPEHLHEQIRVQCEMKDLSLPITHSPEIKVTFRDGLLRFDDMSQQWFEAIQGIRS